MQISSWGRNTNGVADGAAPRGAAPLPSSTCCTPKIHRPPRERSASVHPVNVHGRTHTRGHTHGVFYPAYLRNYCVKLPHAATKQRCYTLRGV